MILLGDTSGVRILLQRAEYGVAFYSNQRVDYNLPVFVC